MTPSPRPHKGHPFKGRPSKTRATGNKHAAPERDGGHRAKSKPRSQPYDRPAKRSGPPPAHRAPAGPSGPLGKGVRILHEDDDLIVVDKPPHLLTVDASDEGRDNLAYRLKRYLTARVPRIPRSRQRDLEAAGKSATLPGPLPGIIHRLDKEASGLLVFSKSRRGYAWLKDDFKNKRVHRMYVAVVEGVMGAVGDAGTIQTFLRETEDGRVKVEPMDAFSGRIAGPDGGSDAARLAVTHYRVLHVGQGRTMVQLRLATGRKNQIRAHMAHKGFPIIGDARFGARTDPIKRVALHATELGFTHAGTGQAARFNSPAPPAFYSAVDAPVPAPVEVAHAQRLRSAPVSNEKDTSWNTVARWYDTLQEGGEGSDHYQQVIIPGTLRLIGPHEGQRILDVACGQGVVSRAMSQLGAGVTGVDAAPDLIATANARGGGTFSVGDARKIAELNPSADGGPFDAATCIMALGNIEPIEPVFEGVASQLRPGGGFVFVVSHPAFRAPGQTSWGWDDASGPGMSPRQFRRVDGYLSPGQHRISMHPGAAPDVTTWTFHRPLQAYVKALAAAGFLVETIEEWAGQRVSQPGPRAAEENRARREIPLFLAVRAVKRGGVTPE